MIYQTVRIDCYAFLSYVGGPTPNKALFKELVAPPVDFSLMVPVRSLVI